MEPGMHWMTSGQIDSARLAAEKSGTLYVEVAALSASQEAFFDAVRESLPLNPPVLGADTWDALQDSLWYGINDLDIHALVIGWLNASTFREKAPTVFSPAYRVFEGVSRDLSDVGFTLGNPTLVSVLLC